MSFGNAPDNKKQRLDARPGVGAGGPDPLAGLMDGIAFGGITPITGLSIDLRVADINSASGWTPQGLGLGGNATPASGFDTPSFASIPKRKRDDDVEAGQSLAAGPQPTAAEPVDVKKQLAIAEGIIKEFFASQELLPIGHDKMRVHGMTKQLVMFFYFDIVHNSTFRGILTSVDRDTNRKIINTACTALHTKLKATDSSFRGTAVKLGTIVSQYGMTLEHYGIGASSFLSTDVNSMEEGLHKLKFGPGLLDKNEGPNWVFYKPVVKFHMNILDPSIKDERSRNFNLAGQMLELLLLYIQDYYDSAEAAIKKSWGRYYEKNPHLLPQAY